MGLGNNPSRPMVKDALNVLVLGVGGNVGQGILKALALSNLPIRVVGACVGSGSMGLYTADKSYISPYATDPRFLDWLTAICRTEAIHAVLCGVEPVLRVLASAADQIKAETGAVPIVSRPESLAVGDDKLATCRWLERNGFAFPVYADASDPDEITSLVRRCGFPLIAKPRDGKGAQGILRLHDAESLDQVVGRAGYVVQEFLGTDRDEYTAACFSDRDYDVRGAIVMRRELLQGTTVRVEVGAFPEVRAEAVRIAAALKPMGPSNLQMRMHRGQAVCFEINNRFSGTTPIRARFGFNDVDAAIRHFVLGDPAENMPEITQGVCLRYWNEVYIDPAVVNKMDHENVLDGSLRDHVVIENYGIAV